MLRPYEEKRVPGLGGGRGQRAGFEAAQDRAQSGGKFFVAHVALPKLEPNAERTVLGLDVEGEGLRARVC